MQPANFNASRIPNGRGQPAHPSQGPFPAGLTPAMNLQPRTNAEEQRLLWEQYERSRNRVTHNNAEMATYDDVLAVDGKTNNKVIKKLGRMEDDNQLKRRHERDNEEYKETTKKEKLANVAKVKKILDESVPAAKRAMELGEKIEKIGFASTNELNAPIFHSMVESHTAACQLAENMDHKIEGVDLSPWLFNTSKNCGVPQFKPKATTGPEAFDTHIKAENGTLTWDGLTGRARGQWDEYCRRIQTFQKVEEKAGLIALAKKEFFEQADKVIEQEDQQKE